MPTYDYRCEANGQVLEIAHSMKEKLMTWGELCERLGMSLGETPADAPIERLATGGQVVSRSSLSNPDAPPCAVGGGCPSGGCGI